MNIFVIRYHLALTIHELPCCATLSGHVIHKMPCHAEQHPAPGENGSRHFRRQTFGRAFGLEVFHQRAVHVCDRITGCEGLRGYAGGKSQIRIGCLNQDVGINGAVFSCDRVANFAAENKPVVAAVTLAHVRRVDFPHGSDIAGRYLRRDTVITGNQPHFRKLLPGDAVHRIRREVVDFERTHPRRAADVEPVNRKGHFKIAELNTLPVLVHELQLEMSHPVL